MLTSMLIYGNYAHPRFSSLATLGEKVRVRGTRQRFRVSWRYRLTGLVISQPQF